MKRYIVIFILIINEATLSEIIGQVDFNWAGGPEHIGLGRATVAHDGISAIYNNPAVLANISGYGFDLHALRRFSLSGLDNIAFGGYFQKGLGVFFCNVQQYGFDSYQEQKMAVGYARRLADQFSVSLQFDYLQLSIDEFGSTGIITAELGFISRISDHVSLGAHIFSPDNQELTNGFSAPTRFRLGPSISIGRNINWLIEIEKTIDRDPVIKSGIRYTLLDGFQVYMGVIPTMSEYAMGFSYIKQNVMVKGGFAYDDLLGISPAIGLSYVVQKAN